MTLLYIIRLIRSNAVCIMKLNIMALCCTAQRLDHHRQRHYRRCRCRWHCEFSPQNFTKHFGN
jgi:hypothetical protein